MKYKFEDIIFNITEKKKPVEEDKYNYIGLEHLESGNLFISKWGSDTAPEGEKIVMKKGDVLFGKRRAYQKKVAISPIDGIFSAHGMVLRPKEDVICKEFLPFFISSEAFLNEAIRISVGGLSPTVNWKDIKELEFDLPSLAEQKVLAEKLWAAYEVKQSYLKMIAATQEMIKAQFIEMFKNAEGSNNWTKITVKEAVNKGYIARPLDGNHGEKHPKGDDYVSEGVPFIMAQDLKDKKVDFENCHFITEKQAGTLTKGWAKSGDVLLTHKGTIGRIAIVQPSQYKNILLTPQITYYRCLKDLDKEYLAAYFATDYFTTQLNSMITGSTRASVTISQQEGLDLIIPPINVQKIFVSIVNQADKSISELRKSIDAIDKVIKSLINENL